MDEKEIKEFIIEQGWILSDAKMMDMISQFKTFQVRILALFQPKIEEARRQERNYIREVGAKWPTKTTRQIIDLIEIRE